MGIRIAICQILTSCDVERRTEQILAWLGKAADTGADVAVFPEVVYAARPDGLQMLDRIGERAIQAADERVVQAAGQLNIATVVGTARRCERGWHNSLLIVDKGGCVRGYYDKLHRAEPWSVPGQRLPIYMLCGVPSCFLVCYDWRFPELTRLYAAAGAKVCYCCAFHENISSEYKMAAYGAIPTVRAAENTIYFVSVTPPANADDLRAGSHGRSRIIAPDGNTLAQGSTFGEQLVIAEIDPTLATGHIAQRALNDETPLKDWLAQGMRFVQTNQAGIDGLRQDRSPGV